MRLAMERVRALLARWTERGEYSGDFDVAHLAADLLDAHAALATERERADSAESAHAECQTTWRAEADAHRVRADAAEAECYAARAEADALRVALADADLILEQRERQITAALTTAAEERARCAAVCREVAGFYFAEDIGSVVAHACAEAIERGPVTP